MKNIIASIRLSIISIIGCVIIYGLINLGFAQIFFPESAQGSLIYNEKGEVVGSSKIAQAFTSPKYFKPRPSAVNYNASGSGGSNLGPNSTKLRERAILSIAEYGATPESPLPTDLATASGSGLDPHISYQAAIYQIPGIAKARKMSEEALQKLVDQQVFYSGGLLKPSKLINVLELNIVLDHNQP